MRYSTFSKTPKPLRRMSFKRAATLGAREECVRIVKERDKVCQAWRMGGVCSGPYDAHEPLMRSRGGDPTDPDACILVCRRHHDAIHDFPTKATKLGLLIPSWDIARRYNGSV